jgi:hypothetical protein
MHRGSFSLGEGEMQSPDEQIFALAALRQEPLGDDDENEVWLRLAFGPNAEGRWTLGTHEGATTTPSSSTLSTSTSRRGKRAEAEKRGKQATPPPAPKPPPTSDGGARAVGDDALGQALVEPDEAHASSLVIAALIALGYPASGNVPLLVEEMSPALHAALTRLVETRPSLPLGVLPAPGDPAVRRRWLGLTPPAIWRRS